MKRTLKLLAIFFISIFLLNFLTPQIDFLFEKSVQNQICYLEKKISGGLSDQLQNEYPEGALFGNLVFALSLIEYTKAGKEVKPETIENAILSVTSEQSKSTFEKSLRLPYGAFYNGWLNYTLKKYLGSKVFQRSNHQEIFLDLHETITNEIVRSQHDSICLLETYTNSIWAADNLLCIASLGEEHNALKEKWLLSIRQASKNKLINHFAADSNEIRGSSQALINTILPEIDTIYGDESYREYKMRFQEQILGISLVKEYESGLSAEDIDSGPIIFGYGSVATIMNNIVLSRRKERGYKSTFGFLNALGLPINWMGEKYYLFGAEPMFDLFMLWNSVEILNAGRVKY